MLKYRQVSFFAVSFLCDFAWTWLENLHHFLNVHDNSWFTTIWHRQFVAALISCRRIAESDITVTPSVMRTDWLHWWYNHAAHVVSSTALAFLKNLSEKHKSTSPALIQVKSWWQTVGIEEKLDVISLLEKGEWIVDICHNVTFAHMSLPSS